MEWLTVSRLNRLETFFRICDFFFLLVDILLLCYRGSTQKRCFINPINAVAQIAPRRTIPFSLFSQKRRKLHSTRQAHGRMDYDNVVWFHGRACEGHAEFISIWFPAIFTIAHKPRSSWTDLRGEEDSLFAEVATRRIVVRGMKSPRDQIIRSEGLLTAKL